MSLLTGPGRNSEMSAMICSKVSMPDLPTSSRWPGDSIWNTPRVRAWLIMWNVAGSSNGTWSSSSRSISTPSVRRTRSTAWAIEDCIRMPSTSSLSSPRSSTSSLSNWLIGNPTKLASTGVRSSSVASESSTPQGWTAMWRGGGGEPPAGGGDGDGAGQPVEPLDEIEEQVEPLVGEPGRAQLGQVAHRHPGVAGPDVGERLGDRVGLARRHPERGPDVTDGVADTVGVHHRDAHAALAAVAVEDRAVDVLPP